LGVFVFKLTNHTLKQHMWLLQDIIQPLHWLTLTLPI